MNLELNLKTKKLFENFSKYSKPTFEINKVSPDKVCSTIYGMYSSTNRRNADLNLTLLSDIFDAVDAEDFAKETSMRAIYEFRELLAEFDDTYGRNLRRYHDDDYHFAVTPKFNWKRGVPDNIKRYIDITEKRYMRPAGMRSIFKRIDDNKWYFNNFKRKAIELDEARNRAKDVCGIAVDNVEELTERQATILQTILKSTNEANKISKYFDIFNFVNTDVLSNDSRNYLGLTIYTMVVAHPQIMTIINNETTEICKLPVPKAYLLFRRPLYKVLANARYTIDTRASSPGGRHPYISSLPYYIRANERTDYYRGNLSTTSSWGTLCLSNYTDDILNPLKKNDYESFVMGLSNWNNIYNIETTHPYKYPKDIFAMVGFLNPEEVTKENDGTISWTSFNKQHCFRQNLSDCVEVEDDGQQIIYNTRITRNIAPYANYIVDSCDLKQCPLRDKCPDYKSIEMCLNSDYQYMIESLTGWLMEKRADTEDPLYRYQVHYTRFALLGYEDLKYGLRHILVENGYWDVPLEETAEIMEARVAEWSRQAILNEERRRHNGAN